MEEKSQKTKSPEDTGRDIDLSTAILTIIAELPFRMTISCVRASDAEPAGVGKVKVTLLDKTLNRYQVEEFTTTQAFQHNMDASGLVEYCRRVMGSRFIQLDAWSEEHVFNLRISKRGRVLLSRKNAKVSSTPAGSKTGNTPNVHAAPDPVNINNRSKRRLLPEGEAIPPLEDLGIFTAEGRVAAPMYDKYKQINRFLELVDEALTGFDRNQITVLDFGCGKFYLTFILYHYLTQVRGIEAHMISLDLKEDVIAHCNETARKYGYDGLHFEMGDIAGFHIDHHVDMMVTLHACDMATDYALANAIDWDVDVILSVPCCQHELNAQISTDKFTVLTRYGIVKERVAALMTDSIRADLLEACGYRTQMLEFVDLSHTPKNLLLRATRVTRSSKVAAAKRASMLTEVETLMSEFHLDPALYRLLKEKNGSDFNFPCCHAGLHDRGSSPRCLEAYLSSVISVDIAVAS